MGWDEKGRDGGGEGYVQDLALLQKAVSIVRVCWQVYCAVFSQTCWKEEGRLGEKKINEGYLPRSGTVCTSSLSDACVENSLLCGCRL